MFVDADQDPNAIEPLLCNRAFHRHRFEIWLRDDKSLRTPWQKTDKHVKLDRVTVPNVHIISEHVREAHLVSEYNGEGQWRLCGMHDCTALFKNAQW